MDYVIGEIFNLLLQGRGSFHKRRGKLARMAGDNDGDGVMEAGLGLQF